MEIRRDTSGANRQAIVFELAPVTLELTQTTGPTDQERTEPAIKLPKSLSITELRKLAESGQSNKVTTRSNRVQQHYRSIAVKRYALARAKGICESCGRDAPFLTKRNEPYLEVHHLNRVADGGPDTPDGVAAICPACHREIHNGADEKQPKCSSCRKNEGNGRLKTLVTIQTMVIEPTNSQAMKTINSGDSPLLCNP